MRSTFPNYFSSGWATFTYTYEFDPIQHGTQSLTLNSSGAVTLSEVPSEASFTLSLAGRALGDQWAIEETLTIGGTPISILGVRLVEAERADRLLRLEFAPIVVAEREMDAGLQSSTNCVVIFEPHYFAPDDYDLGRIYADCQVRDGEMVASFEFGAYDPVIGQQLVIPSEPLQFRAVGEFAIFGPWSLAWPVVFDG